MSRRPTRDLSVGVVMALALLVVAVAIMSVGEESQLFAAKRSYRVVFPNTDGLRIGSPVRMAGVQIGSVSEIDLPTDPEAPGIDVTLGVASEYAARVREDSEASLRYLQLLSGEKYVEVSPGGPGLSELEDGGTIRTKEQKEFFEQLDAGFDIAENVNDITLSLKNILGPLERGEGLLGEMIHNPQFGKEAVDSFSEALVDLESITERISRGEGFLGRALFDEEFAGTLDDLTVAVEGFSKTLEALGNREGAVGEFLKEGGTGEQLLVDLRDAAGSLKRTAARLEADDNLVGKMLNDPEYSQQLADDLQGLLANLNGITGKINRGEGTLGALVNDRAVYDGMEEIVAGVNDSGFARWLMRRYQKKGIKVQDDLEEGAGGTDGHTRPAGP